MTKKRLKASGLIHSWASYFKCWLQHFMNPWLCRKSIIYDISYMSVIWYITDIGCKLVKFASSNLNAFFHVHVRVLNIVSASSLPVFHYIPVSVTVIVIISITSEKPVCVAMCFKRTRGVFLLLLHWQIIDYASSCTEYPESGRYIDRIIASRIQSICEIG